VKSPGTVERPDDADDDHRKRVADRLAAVHARSLFGNKRRWSPRVWALWSAASVVALAVAFILVAVHYDNTVLNSTVCPARTVVNGVLGTTLGTVSGIEFSDFHSCSYTQGADARAVGIDVAVPGGPSALKGEETCRTRHPFTLAGHEACSMAGTPGTTRGRPSLLVESARGNWQFTTDLPSVSMAKLEALARALVKG
jgi:hypothetical protein